MSHQIESDRDYQKNKERVQELKILWKNKTLYSTINKYIETLILTRLQACCSKIVTFKILTQIPISVWIAIFIWFLFPTTSLAPSGMQISSSNF